MRRPGRKAIHIKFVDRIISSFRFSVVGELWLTVIWGRRWAARRSIAAIVQKDRNRQPRPYFSTGAAGEAVEHRFLAGRIQFEYSVAVNSTPPSGAVEIAAAPCTSQYPMQNSGPNGSLLLTRENFVFSASRRFIPAHCSRE
jgi:hypothetical protein